MKKYVACVIALAFFVGAVFYVARQQWDIRVAVQEMQEARNETVRQIEDMKLLQEEYVRILKSKDAEVKREVVYIREKVAEGVQSVPDTGLGTAIAVELELFRRDGGTDSGVAGLDGN